MLFYPSLFILLAVIASKSRPSGRNENKYIFANSNYGADVNIFAANNGTGLNLPSYLSVDMQSVNSWWEEPYHWAPNSEATVTNYSNTTLRCALLACQLPSVKAKLDDPVTSQQISEKYGKCLEQYTSGWKNDASVFNPMNCKGLHSAVSFQQYDSSIVDYTAFFDTTAFHSLPTALNYVSNAILRDVTNNQEAFIITVNHPLPDPEFVGEDYGRSFTLSLYVGIALCIIPGALITSVMRERETKAAHQQLVCGVDSRMLWATYLISDMVLFMIAVIFFFLIFAGTRTDAFIGDNFVATIILFITYGLSVFPCTYAISFYIKSSTSAQSRITAGYISLSLAALIVISVLYAIPSTSDYAEPIDYIFTLIPTYAVAIGVFYISLNELAKSVPGQIVRDPMHWKVAGRPITFLVIEAIFFMALVHFLQTGMVEEWYFKYIKAKEDRKDDEVEMQEAEDIDVKNERARIESSSQPSDAVFVKNLRKVYHGSVETKVAVKNMSFGIPEGECFGLLGPNGAGKTTTLSMLAGDFPPTSGEIRLRGYDMISEKLKAFKHISLCPQVDPLIDLMTGREHMLLFGALKGIPDEKIHKVADHTLDMLGLAEHADKRSMTYSGGNKRKLALGIALLGDPKVIFLDEPSTGMDPGARRFMWDVISNFLPGRSIILTTHSMEECEALCTRIGIVVNGYMKCIGSSQHLKSRFGGGYRLDLQCAWSTVPEVKAYIAQLFPTANLLEWHGGKLRYEVPREDLDLGKVFDEVEQNRKRLQILDYALSQTTLEQVFINFARTQIDENH